MDRLYIHFYYKLRILVHLHIVEVLNYTLQGMHHLFSMDRRQLLHLCKHSHAYELSYLSLKGYTPIFHNIRKEYSKKVPSILEGTYFEMVLKFEN